ncbi:MAG: hypothetical protein CHACPFDD_00770 [Phycisphaerae bacterium]|nr:hypothetical protein [Phycisphaerae bacterium]
MTNVKFAVGGKLDVRELDEFYGRVNHEIDATPQQLSEMIDRSTVFVTARNDGQLIGIARGVSDGLRGWLTECKLDPAYQGPAAVTRTDGRIEHDTSGVAAEMARRVIGDLQERGITRIDVMAWGTEVDFLEELGFRRSGGLVGMTLRTHGPGRPAADAAVSAAR